MTPPRIGNDIAVGGRLHRGGSGGGGGGGAFDLTAALTERWIGTTGVYEDAGATDAAEDGDSVNVWRGANGIDFVGYAGRFPTWDEAAGALVFDVVSEHGMRILDATDMGTGLHHSVHMVLNVTEPAVAPQIFLQSSALRLYLTNSWPLGICVTEESGGLNDFGYVPSGGIQLISVEMDDVAGEAYLYINNVAQGSAIPYVGTAWDANIYWPQLDLMNRNNTGLRCDGEVHDLGILTSADPIDADTREDIRAAYVTEYSL